MATFSLGLALVAFYSSYALSDEANAEPSISDLMTTEQYRKAGLDQLSEAQREALSVWLHDYVDTKVNPATVNPVATARPAPPVRILTEPSTSVGVANTEPNSKPLDKNWGFSNPPKQKSERQNLLYASIKGKFNGWSGKTIFHLDNGQVWRQRRSGRFNYTGDARRVVIRESRWGFYEMQLIDADRKVGVSRIK